MFRFSMIVLLVLTTSAAAQSRDKDSGRDSGPSRSESSDTDRPTATRLKSDGAIGPKTEYVERTLRRQRVALPGSGARGRLGGYISGVPVTEGWVCNDATGVCECSGVADCQDLVLAGENGAMAEITVLYTVQADDHSSGGE